MKYYECHVTMTGTPEHIRPLVEMLKWKFSMIDGDILLGDGTKCYATRLFNKRITQAGAIVAVRKAAKFLSKAGCNVVRRKVELVLFDDRSSKMRCKGGCIDCHLDDIKDEDCLHTNTISYRPIGEPSRTVCQDCGALRALTP